MVDKVRNPHRLIVATSETESDRPQMRDVMSDKRSIYYCHVREWPDTDGSLKTKS